MILAVSSDTPGVSLETLGISLVTPGVFPGTPEVSPRTPGVSLSTPGAFKGLQILTENSQETSRGFQGPRGFFKNFRSNLRILGVVRGLDWPRSGPVPKFQDRTEFLRFGPVRSGKKSDRTGLHQKDYTVQR